MLLTGRAMLQVSSTTVVTILTTLSLWLAQIKNHGSSKTHGALLGENKDTLDWPRVTPAASVKGHPSQFDLKSV